MMYYTASLTPQELIIEADNDEEFHEKIKHITIENLVFRSGKMTKEAFQKELKARHIYLKS